MSGLLTRVPALDAVLDAHAPALGRDRIAYRNHTYRVVNLCVLLAGEGSAVDPDRLERIALAAAFHDLGIWTDRTFDYLQPSVRLATAHLARIGRSVWAPEITAMILLHHRIRRAPGGAPALVEPFRRADWIDVSGSLFTSGAPRAAAAEIRSMWPSAGFHTRLARLAGRRLLTHPWSPLPMLRF